MVNTSRFTALAIALAVLTAGSLAANARDIESELGFGAEIPNDWTYLSSATVKDDPSLLEIASELPSSELRKEFLTIIQTGNVEFYYLPNGTDEFADNINVIQNVSGVVPKSQFECLMFRSLFVKLAPELLGSSIKMHRCELVTMPSGTALVMEYDMTNAKHRTITYLLGKRPGGKTSLTITGSFSPENLKTNRAALHDFVSGMRFEK